MTFVAAAKKVSNSRTLPTASHKERSKLQYKRNSKSLLLNKNNKEVIRRTVETLPDQTDKVEKIRGNLELLNQIMSMKQPGADSDFGGRFFHSRAQSVYLPLPNHNYVQSGKLSL